MPRSLAHNVLTVELIASRKNPLVAQMRRLAQGADQDVERILLDGLHLVEEARAARLPLAVAAFSTRALGIVDGRARRLATALAGVGVRVVQVSDPVMDAMSPAATPSGVVAVAIRPHHALEGLLPPDVPNPFLLVVVDVQDPGNVGAIARVVEAAGGTGLVVAGTSADPFGWKALRGSMGSAFRVPIAIAKDAIAALDAIKAAGVGLVATSPIDAVRFDGVDWKAPTAVLLGSEGGGLREEALRLADARVSIPMAAPVESLNVAVSAALIAYEARRQRGA